MIPVLETPRMRLRGWTEADLEPFAELMGNRDVTQFLGVQPFGREKAIADGRRLGEQLDATGSGWFVAEVKDALPFAGVISLKKVPFEAHFTPAYEVGWVFLPRAWGHGYATEAARAVLDYAFKTIGLDEVVALAAAANVRSQRVMQKLGMTHDPSDDFDHPLVEADHLLKRCVLYRIKKP